MAQTNKQKQDKRKERLQAAAVRDGFETWSQALTAWWKGEARLTKRVPDQKRAGSKSKRLPTPAASGR